MEDFTVIAITREDFIENEASKIETLLRENKAHLVHIRKPGSTEEQIERLIKSISPELYDRIKLHDHFELCLKYKLNGVHLNSRNNSAPEGVKHISKSCHSEEETENANEFDYVTLSPVFDSISKSGYKSKFKLEDLKQILKGKKVIALGGVTPDRFAELQEAGFSGAAMMGHFW